MGCRKDNRKHVAYLCCALIGAAVFLLLYGIRPLDVTYDAWIYNGYIETDITQRYAGWIAYRNSESFFPLTWSPFVSFPFGGYTSLTDSIPLAEVFFKLLSPILPQTFQFCGLICFFNMALQGLCGGLLAGSFTDDKLSILLSGTLFCFSPVLLERLFRHTSLSFHWIILLAVWLYIRSRRSAGIKVYWAFLFLSVITVWLHLYFTPMILGIFVAAILDSLARKEPAFKKLVLLAGAIALCLFSAKILGLLDMGISNTSGYGYMGMNLNALWNPISLGPDWWVPGKGWIHWSRFLPMLPLAENNIESFNYLGLGVLLAVVAALIWLLTLLIRYPRNTANHIVNVIRKAPFLLCFCLFSGIFAISNVVCVNSKILFSIELPQAIASVCSAFRASGRLFWSVYYLIFLGAILLIFRKCPGHKWGIRCALLLLLVVQVVDLSPALIEKYNSFQTVEISRIAENGEQVMQWMNGKDTLYNLELRDDRAMCAYLLSEGISSNFWLISRDGYGVQELNENISQTTKKLLQGENPYPNCLYSTTNPDLAEQLTQFGDVYESSGIWYYLPNGN